MDAIKSDYKLANTIRTKLLLFIDMEIQTQKQSKNQNQKDTKFAKENISEDLYKITFEEEFSHKKETNYYYIFSKPTNCKIIDFASNKYINKNKSPETRDATPGRSKYFVIPQVKTLKRIHRCHTIQKEIMDPFHKNKIIDELTEKETKRKSKRKGSDYLQDLYSSLKSKENLIKKLQNKNKKSLFIPKTNNINIKNKPKRKSEKNNYSPKLSFPFKKISKKSNSNSIIKLIMCK